MSGAPLPSYGANQGYFPAPYPPPPPYLPPSHPHYVPQPPYNPQYGQPVYTQPLYSPNQNEGYQYHGANSNRSEVSWSEYMSTRGNDFARL